MRKQLAGPVAGLLALGALGLVFTAAHAAIGRRPLKKHAAFEKLRDILRRHVGSEKARRLISSAMQLPPEERTVLTLANLARQQLTADELARLEADPELRAVIQEQMQ